MPCDPHACPQDLTYRGLIDRGLWLLATALVSADNRNRGVGKPSSHLAGAHGVRRPCGGRQTL